MCARLPNRVTEASASDCVAAARFAASCSFRHDGGLLRRPATNGEVSLESRHGRAQFETGLGMR